MRVRSTEYNWNNDDMSPGLYMAITHQNQAVVAVAVASGVDRVTGGSHTSYSEPLPPAELFKWWARLPEPFADEPMYYV